MPVAVATLQEILDEYQSQKSVVSLLGRGIFGEPASIKQAKGILSAAQGDYLSSAQACELLYGFVRNHVERGSAAYEVFEKCVRAVLPGLLKEGGSGFRVEDALRALLERRDTTAYPEILRYQILECDQRDDDFDPDKPSPHNAVKILQMLVKAGVSLEEGDGALPYQMNHQIWCAFYLSIIALRDSGSLNYEAYQKLCEKFQPRVDEAVRQAAQEVEEHEREFDQPMVQENSASSKRSLTVETGDDSSEDLGRGGKISPLRANSALPAPGGSRELDELPKRPASH